ncbi:MAG: hypothetical protein KatS3mg087_1822 [Patescibacteria group bacterium]|nr:MAG: hypothetical protein KatS3mg087_1822 [Patescibacteria group bacterium]
MFHSSLISMLVFAIIFANGVIGTPPVPPGHAGIFTYLERDGYPGQSSYGDEPALSGIEIYFDCLEPQCLVGVTDSSGVLFVPMLVPYKEVTIYACPYYADICDVFINAPLAWETYTDLGLNPFSLWLPFVGNQA